MEFPSAWLTDYCAPGSDRFTTLLERLDRSRRTYEILRRGDAKHVHLYGRRSKSPQDGETILVAHYDRFLGSPGANDNAASVEHILAYWEKPRRSGHPIRTIFTDAEELTPGQDLTEQGSYALAKTWIGNLTVVPVVLDMTGIGDTFVLGHLAQKLVERLGGSADERVAIERMRRVRLQARRVLAGCGAGDYVEIDTPFSDDLGFLLAGIPAIQISLLPRKQALAYGKKSELPPAWAPMHTAADTVETLEPRTRALVVSFLEKLESFPF